MQVVQYPSLWAYLRYCRSALDPHMQTLVEGVFRCTSQRDPVLNPAQL